MQQNDTIVVTVRETPSKQPDGLVAPSESLAAGFNGANRSPAFDQLSASSTDVSPWLFSSASAWKEREREREREREARYTRDCFFFLLEADRITDPTH